MEKYIFKNSSYFVNDFQIKLKKTTDNGDAGVSAITLEEHIEKVCKETFLDGNGNNSSLPKLVTVDKIQVMEILGTW